MSQGIDERVKSVICEHLGVDAQQVTEQSRFTEDLNADSLDALDLLMGVNEVFDTRIPAEKLPELNTVQDLINEVKASIK